MADLELAEKEKMKEKVEMICKHDINVFINRQLIYNYPEQLFADKGKFFLNFFNIFFKIFSKTRTKELCSVMCTTKQSNKLTI